jgi:hypothetical protein
MRANVVTGYDSEPEESNKYPFCLVTVLAEPTDGSERRVATYIQLGVGKSRESRLFVERSPPGMGWLKKVFELIADTGKLGMDSGGLHEIRVDCEDQIEVLEDGVAVIDHRESKVYFDDGNCGDTTALADWKHGSSTGSDGAK